MNTDIHPANSHETNLQAFLREHRDLKKGCEAFIKSLPSDEKVRLEALVAETTFHRRKYGQCDFYCWPIHPVFDERPTDPWPASRYPKAVLMSEFAIRTQQTA